MDLSNTHIVNPSEDNMFLNHTTAFAEFAPAKIVETAPTLTLGADTMLETATGWLPVDQLAAGDAVATLDGGLTSIQSISKSGSAPLIHVPGGTLSACSDCALPVHSRVALEQPAHLGEAPIVSVPLLALVGWRGIRHAVAQGTDLATLTFADEEMVFAQTGLLLHAAAPQTDGFFERLDHDQTRTLLARIDGRMMVPERIAA